MKKKKHKLKPAVTNHLLIFVAGTVWLLVGFMLLSLAFTWLSKVSNTNSHLFIIVGAVCALLIHHYGFLKIADKNLKRIFEMENKSCIFAFIPWKSYLIIAIMVLMGALLRHSIIPKHYLAVLYIAIGLALVLSSIRYLKAFFQELGRR